MLPGMYVQRFILAGNGLTRAENGDVENGRPECMATVLYACGGSTEDTDKGFADGAQAKGEEGLLGISLLRILAHAWPLPKPARKGGGPGVQVLVAGSGRSLPRAKHSSWLRERKPLDELKAQVGCCGCTSVS